jgi:hypothetical protein
MFFFVRERETDKVEDRQGRWMEKNRPSTTKYLRSDGAMIESRRYIEGNDFDVKGAATK